jgi:hypothetical protein
MTIEIPQEASSDRISPLLRRALIVLALVVLNVPLYAAALDRFFAADQIRYFNEVGADTRASACLSLWDYTASRRIGKGDDLLFRPLTGLLLAGESALFGHRYRAWNIVHLVLHLAVCFALFELLWALQPSMFAAAVALLFSVLTSNFELVVWNHLSGYLLGFGLLLLSILATLRLSKEDGTERKKWLIVYAAATFAAACCHEIAVIGAAVTAASIAWASRRRGARLSTGTIAALIAPLATYGLLYIGHILRCERWLWTDPRGPVPPPLVFRVAQCLGLWALKALDPWSAEFVLKNCDRFAWSDQPAGTGTVLLFIGLAAGLVLCLRRGLTRDRLRDAGPFSALLAGLLLAYTLMINVGRPYAATVTYYAYFFALLAMAALYSLVDFRRVGRKTAFAALALLLGLASANAYRVRHFSRQLAELNAPTIEYFDTIERFVEEHRLEPGFAFAIRAPDHLDPFSFVWKGYPDHPPDDEASVSELLYPEYFDATLFKTGPDPKRHKYVLIWNSGPPKPKSP